MFRRRKRPRRSPGCTSARNTAHPRPCNPRTPRPPCRTRDSKLQAGTRPGCRSSQRGNGKPAGTHNAPPCIPRRPLLPTRRRSRACNPGTLVRRFRRPGRRDPPDRRRSHRSSPRNMSRGCTGLAHTLRRRLGRKRTSPPTTSSWHIGPHPGRKSQDRRPKDIAFPDSTRRSCPDRKASRPDILRLHSRPLRTSRGSRPRRPRRPRRRQGDGHRRRRLAAPCNPRRPARRREWPGKWRHERLAYPCPRLRPRIPNIAPAEPRGGLPATGSSSERLLRPRRMIQS